MSVGVICLPALLLAGCTDDVACKAQTLLLAIALDTTASNADQLVVDVTLDGVGSTHTPLPHSAGHARGNIEIDFQSGYPVGDGVTVEIAALALGRTVATGHLRTMLAQSCTAAMVAVSVGGAAPDGASAVDAAVDAGAPDDASALVDAAVDGGAPPGSDMACAFRSAEDCYNGIDDDCNGLVDCADPVCANVVTCVAAAPGFTLGALAPENGACPARYTTGTTIHADLDGGVACAGCSCTGDGGCTATIFQYGGNTCPGTHQTPALGTTTGPCQQFVQPSVGGLHIDPYVFAAAAACSAHGSPARTTPKWGATRVFCAVDSTGGGCGVGYVCVPKTTAQRCALIGGSSGCPPQYTQNGGPWYDDYDDQRTCGGCQCGSPTGGDCGATIVRLFTDTGCTVDVSGRFPGDACSIFDGLNGAKLEVAINPPVCTPSSAVGGTLAPLGPHSLCCQ